MKTILLIAGLDPTAGAGLLADARVAADHGVRAVGVATALTLQDTRGVRAVKPTARPLLADQLRLLLDDLRAVDAVKIGMLGNRALAAIVAQTLRSVRAPIVWDPVLKPSRGRVPLFAGSPRAAVRELLALARLVVPNRAEAEALTGVRVDSLDGMRRAAAALRAAGAAAVLVKGGHLPGARAIDILDDGGAVTEFAARRVDAGDLHGTGCVLSTAIACELAAGASLADAVRSAKAYLTVRLRRPIAVGKGARTLV